MRSASSAGLATIGLNGVAPGSFAEPLHDWHRDVLWEQYRDGVTLLERLVLDVEMPTIGVLNGAGSAAGAGPTV